MVWVLISLAVGLGFGVMILTGATLRCGFDRCEAPLMPRRRRGKPPARAHGSISMEILYKCAVPKGTGVGLRLRLLRLGRFCTTAVIALAVVIVVILHYCC